MLLIKPYQPCNILLGLVDLTNSDQFYENVTKTIFFLFFSLFLILNLRLIPHFISSFYCLFSLHRTYVLRWVRTLNLLTLAYLNDSVNFLVRPYGPDRLTYF